MSSKRSDTNSRGLHREAARLAIAGVAALLCGCGVHTPRVRLSAEVERPERFAVLFFVDGLDRGVLGEMLQRGEAPNIRRRFVEGGVRVERAVSSIPAMTYPNTVSILTGLFPGHHGITGNQWFDRRTLEGRDYITGAGYFGVNWDFFCPTIFERMSRRFTVNVQCPTYRGATYAHDTSVATGLAWGAGLFEQVDQLSAGSIEEVAAAAGRVGRWPSLVVHYFPGVDEIGHLWGSDSEAYRHAVGNVDAQIGRVCDALEHAGLLASATLALVSDHGHLPSDPKRRVDVVGWLKRVAKLRVREGAPVGLDYPARVRAMREVDAVVIDGSSRRLEIHLRPPGGWASPVERPGEPVTAEVGSFPFSELAELPGVEMVCMPAGPDRVRFVSSRGAGSVERRRVEGRKEYRLMFGADSAEGGDPWRRGPKGGRTGEMPVPEGLGEGRNEMTILEGWRDSRAWLEATAGDARPDFVPQIVEFFDSPRSPDVVVFAAEGWSFGGAAAGVHGSCLARDMLSPMMFAGPGLEGGATIGFARLVDMTPTLLELLGEREGLSADPAMDGVSIASLLRAARRGS